jgi:hypothetical protein
MDYKHLSGSFSSRKATPKPPWLVDTMVGRFALRRQTGPAKYLRYVVLVGAVLFIWVHLFPTQSQVPIEEYEPTSGFIQYAFKRETPGAKKIRISRRQEVKKAFLHGWKGYKEHAWLHDEIMPVSGGHKDNYVGWAATLVDGLDTLYIMGLKKEFESALGALRKIDFSKPNAERVPVFETSIRYLGGMLGAYDVSEGKYPILLEKSKQLGELLLRAFNTPNGIPVPYYWWEQKNAELRGEANVLVAQIGECRC